MPGKTRSITVIPAILRIILFRREGGIEGVAGFRLEVNDGRESELSAKVID